MSEKLYKIVCLTITVILIFAGILTVLLFCTNDSIIRCICRSLIIFIPFILLDVYIIYEDHIKKKESEK